MPHPPPGSLWLVLPFTPTPGSPIAYGVQNLRTAEEMKRNPDAIVPTYHPGELLVVGETGTAVVTAAYSGKRSVVAQYVEVLLPRPGRVNRVHFNRDTVRLKRLDHE